MLRLILYCCCVSTLLPVLPIQANNKFCNERSLSYEKIKLLSVNCTDSCTRSTLRGYTYFFPQLTINCTGSLVAWTAAGKLSHGDIESNPVLIVWRASLDNPREYRLHQKTSLLACNGTPIPRNSQQVYTCELGKELPVQEGDVMGMEIPEYFDSDRSIFYPYFESSSHSGEKIYVQKGTSLLNFITSRSITDNLQPLLAVDIVPEDPNLGTENIEDIMTTGITDETVGERKITLELWKVIGIAAGAFVLLLLLAVVLIIQCYVIMRKQNKREKPSSMGNGEYSAEPYAIVDVQEVETTTSTKSASRQVQRKECLIPLNKNPSYAINLSPSVANRSAHGSRPTYTNSEEALLRASSTSPNHNEVQTTHLGGVETNESDALPDRIGRYHQNPHDDTSSENEEENYMYIENIRGPDEIDSGINVQQLNSTTGWNRELSETHSEHIYY